MSKDRSKLIAQVVAALRSDDHFLLEDAQDNIEDAEIWRAAVVELVRTHASDPIIAERFHDRWTATGHRIREKVRDDDILLDALRVLLPKYNGPGVSLYRGENFDRWTQGLLGFAWTQRQDIARMFGRGLNAGYGQGGVLLSTDAPPEAIIAGPSQHSVHLDEHEYVVDPRRLREIVLVERYPRS